MNNFKSKMDAARYLLCEAFGLKSIQDVESVQKNYQEYQEELFDYEEEEWDEYPNASDCKLVYPMNMLLEIVMEEAAEKYDISISRNTVLKALEDLLEANGTVLVKSRIEQIPFEVYNYESSPNSYYIYVKLPEPQKVLTASSLYEEMIETLEVALHKVLSLDNKVYENEVRYTDNQQKEFLKETATMLMKAIFDAKGLRASYLEELELCQKEETDYEPKA